MEILVKFGNKLRKEKESRGMSQEELGYKANLSVYYISRIERGKANSSLETVYKISKALSMKLKDLVDF